MKGPGKAFLTGTMILLITSCAIAKTPKITWTQESDDWVGRVTWETKVGEKGLLDVREFIGRIDIVGDASKHAAITIEFRADGRLEREEVEALAEEHFPTLETQRKRLKVRGRESRWQHGDRGFDLYMVANLPKQFDVYARTGAGSIQVHDLEGDISLASGGGSIEVVNSVGNVDVATGGGSILIEQVKGDMDVRTGGGSIDLYEVNAPKRTSIQTGAGSIALSQSEGDYVLRTGAGSIELRNHMGSVKASSGAGSIDARHHNGGIIAQTGTGSIDVEIEQKLKNRDEIELGSGFGSIELLLPSDFEANVYALVKDPKRTNAIESDYPLSIELSRDDELVGEGELNGGGVPVRLEVARSRIRIRKM